MPHCLHIVSTKTSACPNWCTMHLRTNKDGAILNAFVSYIQYIDETFQEHAPYAHDNRSVFLKFSSQCKVHVRAPVNVILHIPSTYLVHSWSFPYSFLTYPYRLSFLKCSFVAKGTKELPKGGDHFCTYQAHVEYINNTSHHTYHMHSSHAPDNGRAFVYSSN